MPGASMLAAEAAKGKRNPSTPLNNRSGSYGEAHWELTDLRDPRPPTRTKYIVQETDPHAATLATTFGKSLRETALPLLSTGGGVGEGHLNSTQYTSLKSTVGKTSAWGASAHHVTFRGSTDLSSLLGRRRAMRIEAYDPKSDEFNREFAKPGTVIFDRPRDPLSADQDHQRESHAISSSKHSTRRSSPGQLASGKNASPLKNSDLEAHRNRRAVSPPNRDQPLYQHRNLHARSIADGRAVSTFGGALRDGGEAKFLQERLSPGPGQYYQPGETVVKRRGILQGGLKERGHIFLTKSGLVSETPIHFHHSSNHPSQIPRAATATPGASRTTLVGTGETPLPGITVEQDTPIPLQGKPKRDLLTPSGEENRGTSSQRPHSEGASHQRPNSQMNCMAIYPTSGTFNVQLRDQEHRWRKLMHIPDA